MAIIYSVRGVGEYCAFGLSSDTKETPAPDASFWVERDTAKTFKAVGGAWVDVLNSSYSPALVSAVNIKTINGSSVLGAGDLVVSGETNIVETEIDFGTGLYQSDKTFTITDAACTTAKSVMVQKILKSPSDSRQVDEIKYQKMEMSAVPNNGSFDLNIMTEGSFSGKMIVGYIIG